MVIGIGPIGGQISSRLETIGRDLAIIDIQAFAPRLYRAGASAVVSEEREAAGPLIQRCARWIQARQTATGPRRDGGRS